MSRTFVALFVVIGMASTLGAQQQPAMAAGRDQRAMRADVAAMNQRLASGRPSPAQTIADAQRIAAIYGGLGPYGRAFGPAEYELNRHLAEESFAWLTRSRALYLTDWTVAPYLMRAYGAMGAFYRDYGSFYPAAAFMSYAGASRVARLLYLSGADSSIDHNLEAYALAYATAACSGALCFDWWAPPQGFVVPDPAPTNKPAPTPQVTQLPAIDTSRLSSEQRAQWAALQDRFRPVAARVLEARSRVANLVARLAARGMTVNPGDAAVASSMQGFLDDAVELAAAFEFPLASEAVMRADYTRSRLKNLIGE